MPYHSAPPPSSPPPPSDVLERPLFTGGGTSADAMNKELVGLVRVDPPDQAQSTVTARERLQASRAYPSGSVNNVNYNIDQTVRVFDSFYEYDVNVPAAEYDIVYSYFRREMTTANAAGNFTVSLFRVAEETRIAALDLLEQFRGENGVSLNVQLAYYLNSIRNKATLLGVGTPIQSNRYAARLIVQ